MIPLLAAILLAGAAGAGPVLVGDACGSDTTTTSDDATSRCAVETIEQTMKAKSIPAELKVEADGKLYSVPEGVKMLTPKSQTYVENWWKGFIRKLRELCDGDSTKAKIVVSSDSNSTSGATEDRETRSGSDSPSDDGDDGSQGEVEEEKGATKTTLAVEKDVRSTGEHSCQICFEHDHSTVMLPCGHGGLCWDCGLQIYALTEECPMCRNKIELLVKVDGARRRYEGEDEFVASVVCA
ncbi:unnamed protein product [Scytosiphon promiscuus]